MFCGPWEFPLYSAKVTFISIDSVPSGSNFSSVPWSNVTFHSFQLGGGTVGNFHISRHQTSDGYAHSNSSSLYSGNPWWTQSWLWSSCLFPWCLLSLCQLSEARNAFAWLLLVGRSSALQIPWKRKQHHHLPNAPLARSPPGDAKKDEDFWRKKAKGLSSNYGSSNPWVSDLKFNYFQLKICWIPSFCDKPI